MGDVVILGGITKADLPPERILSAALEAGMERVVIVGLDADGNEYFAFSSANREGVLWDLQRAAYRLLHDAQEDT